MVSEVRPMGVRCNLKCLYCYQHLDRELDQDGTHSYDLNVIKAAIEKTGKDFILFGGEALLMPEKDLEDLWAWGFNKFGRNGLQTNGALINDRHIELFKKYNVQIGVSIDGPGELNDARWAGSPKATRETTRKTEAAIEKIRKAGLNVSLIITIHRKNGTSEKLSLMHAWFRKLRDLGIKGARLHLLESETPAIEKKLRLTPEECLNAFLSFKQLAAELAPLEFDIFRDVRNMLLGKDEYATCHFVACDPYANQSVYGIEADGKVSMCGRTDKDGVIFVKCDQTGYERYIALYHTPQEHGGCDGCRFFLACKGNCPGTGIDGDWRNRTVDCAFWKGLFRHTEEELLDQGEMPITAYPERKELENAFLTVWAEGRNTRIATEIQRIRATQDQAKAKDTSKHCSDNAKTPIPPPGHEDSNHANRMVHTDTM